jgi:methionine-rich copper-binding protein CopC
MSSKLALLLAAAVLLVVPATALAHSEITSTKPEQGARVAHPPQRVEVRFSEPPADVRIRVVDGCGDRVSGRSAIVGSAATTPISDGAGGGWKVVVKTISSADDHLATERFGFRVAGKARCEEQENAADPSPTQTLDAAAAGSQEADATRPAAAEDGGQGLTVAALVAGVVVVLGAAGVMKLRKRT